ncbi:UDP-N-acetylmuramoyl-L-alanine--D-glutamate ligase [Pelomonas sp. APW6]|uniref:UDP-N-acetylmuramoylalanine--D-glutamate ligase n=1 Tax=Roseateles subflavus TaxID=3053353 RepID=A0ABT7LG35_9BURK|nr:UDP-N-acetylmuramoyl-L-alanine--D-glutamate ligase [Pelomonas sp. APW6]MDL5031817.1 UDP-N-acetylmuramoyl-L-alanine--D-glutamate ligase [Pelomonas sp. APW6]
MRHLKDLSLLILGLGDSGLAMAAWGAKHGAARLQVWDSREQPPQLATLREQLPAAEFFHGELPESALSGVHLVLKSPGLSPLDGRLVPLLSLAKATGIPVQGELDLFARALADLKAERRYEPAVLAITGTNGKTTTTCMTALLAERAGKRVAVAGNIGPSMLGLLGAAMDLEPAQALAALDADAVAGAEAGAEAEAPTEPVAEDTLPLEAAGELPPEAPDAEALPVAEEAEAPLEAALDEETAPVIEAAAADEPSALEAVAALLDEQPLPINPPPPKPPVFEHLPEVWVLELSSFQLDTVVGFEPTAAAVLNLTQDHLDWHGDMAAYARAKARIFGQQALMIINRDDAEVEAMVPAPVPVKQGRGRPTKLVSREVVRFGLNAPTHPGDYGLVVEGGMAWLVRARESDDTVKRRKDEPEEILLQRLMPADALRVRGRHNAANALAALALASAAGCALAPMLHGLREYRGEPHRVEYVATVRGVDFYDDSKGTNVGATVAAILGLGADRAPAKLVMILGGDGKGQDFSPLREGLARHARAVALIGRDAPALAATLDALEVPVQTLDTLEAATRWCLEQAQSGDSVLLSPACASLDMFRNYAHRAEVFVATVESLANEEGLA